MTEISAAEWHGDEQRKAEELSQRLGRRFSELCVWAANENLEDTLEIAYLILGLDERTVGIPNLVEELSHPESLTTLGSWESHAIAQQLDQFAKTFRANSAIGNRHKPLSHEGSAQRTRRRFENLKNQTFLLTLITHPLAHPQEDQLYTERRRLRLWLIVQAAERVLQHGCAADSAISSVSRHLILDPDDPRWKVVDQLLVRVRQLRKRP